MNTEKQIRILVAEDEEVIRSLIGRFLADEGYVVELAADGMEAERAIFERDFDLVISDVMMPGQTGLDLIRKIRFADRSCRIITMTGHPCGEHIPQCLDADVSRYMRKPFQMAELVATVKDVLLEREAKPVRRIQSEVEGFLEFELSSSDDSLRRSHHFIEQYLRQLTATDEAKQIAAAFYEMARNAMEWGNRSVQNLFISVRCLALADRVLFKIQDQGQGFDIASVFRQPVDPFERQSLRALEGKRPGGYGIEITRKYMDEFYHNETGNCVVMCKFLQAQRNAI